MGERAHLQGHPGGPISSGQGLFLPVGNAKAFFGGLGHGSFQPRSPRGSRCVVHELSGRALKPELQASSWRQSGRRREGRDRPCPPPLPPSTVTHSQAHTANTAERKGGAGGRLRFPCGWGNQPGVCRWRRRGSPEQGTTSHIPEWQKAPRLQCPLVRGVQLAESRSPKVNRLQPPGRVGTVLYVAQVGHVCARC